jgi:hypothetical protein
LTIHLLLQAQHLEQLLEPLGRHVRSFYGNQGGGSLPKDTAVAVCTIEKANSLVNKLLEDGRLSELGVIVIDELHMVRLSKAKVLLRKYSLFFPTFFYFTSRVICTQSVSQCNPIVLGTATSQYKFVVTLIKLT